MKRLLLTACIVSLAACGGSKDDVNTGYEDIIRERGQSLTYAYPIDEQRELPISAPIVLHFSSAIDDPAGANVVLTEQGSANNVAVSVTSVGDGKGLVITPNQRLKPLTTYEITVPKLALADGESSERRIRFTTRGLYEGPQTAVGRDSFTVERRFPDGDTLPVADMSTLRLQMTQPVDRSTVKYGASADSTLWLTDASNNLVEAHVLVGDNYLTIDPKSDLVGGESYTLTISPELKSNRGLSLPGSGIGNANFTWQFTALDTRPPATDGNPDRNRARMVQIIDDSNVDSPLTGKRVNLVPMYSVLLGPEGSSNPATPQASGYLAAELAHIPEHDETTPLRIDRGSLIVAGDLAVHIGGEVPAGFNSGNVNMEFLSDATGYMIENPYSTHPDAPKLVRLMMDMGISAEGDIANGSVTQTLMHIELVGTALVEDGLLTINAVGVVEPNILGTERASAVLSFYMQGLDDQVNAPEPPVDERPLDLVSWTLADQINSGNSEGANKSTYYKVGEPIVFNFNRSIEPESISGRVSLDKILSSGEGEPVLIKYHADGASLVVNPQENLQSPTENGGELSYMLKVDSGVESITGGQISNDIIKSFALPYKVQKRELLWQDSSWDGDGNYLPIPPDSTRAPGIRDVEVRSPYILGVYPGFPCALNETYADLSSGVAGKCAGGIGENSFDLPVDDLLPLLDVPANRPIKVIFSKEMARSSVVLGTTFSVFEVDAQGNENSEVSGSLLLEGDVLTFTPESPWESGVIYKYVMKSNDDMGSNAANCSGEGAQPALCSTDGLPLQTQLIADVNPEVQQSNFYGGLSLIEVNSPAADGGGPDFSQYFKGAPASENVLQMLRLSQIRDTNANLIIDDTPTVITPVMGPELGVKKALIGSTMRSSHMYVMPDGKEGELNDVVWGDDFSTEGLTDSMGYGIPLDPNGVQPPVNSAKILSGHYGLRHTPDNIADLMPLSLLSGTSTQTFGANVGCGFSERFHHEAQGSQCMMSGSAGSGVLFGLKSCWYAEPVECPNEKFTYINGALFAEVTDEVDSLGRIIVNIYPGQMLSTSIRIYTRSHLGPQGEVVDSGYQLMRMRYDDGDLITGYIQQDGDSAKMTVDVDLYVDSPGLVYDFTEVKNIMPLMNHNLYSYPISLSLEGDVRFLDDGRMIVRQTNTNDALIEMRGNAPPTSIDLLIPEGGINLEYISSSIK